MYALQIFRSCLTAVETVPTEGGADANAASKASAERVTPSVLEVVVVVVVVEVEVVDVLTTSSTMETIPPMRLDELDWKERLLGVLGVYFLGVSLPTVKTTIPTTLVTPGYVNSFVCGPYNKTLSFVK